MCIFRHAKIILLCDFIKFTLYIFVGPGHYHTNQALLLTWRSDIYVCISDFLTIFAARNATVCRNVSECGEIWLLATTWKNAKIHAPVRAAPDPSASMFLCFWLLHMLWGFFVLSTCHSFAAKVLQVPAFPRAPVTVLREKRNRWHHSPAQPQTKHKTGTTLK